MKNVVLIILIISANNIKAQFADKTNPDGEGISIHLTPFINTAAETLDGKETRSYKDNFNFSLLIKIPLSSAITISPFWERKTFTPIRTDTELHEFNLTQTKTGLTLSVYFD